jgi:hypothetical protein
MKRLVVIVVIMLSSVNVSGIRRSQAATSSEFDHSLIGVVSAGDGVPVAGTLIKPRPIIGTLGLDQRVIITGRNEDSTWVRVHSHLGYGYVPTTAFAIRGDLERLPIVAGDLPVEVLPKATAPDDPEKYPVLPVVTEHTREIFQQGLQKGNRATVFSKVGDCMTADVNLFLGRFGSNAYNLGKYQDLQNVITYFKQESPRKGAVNSFRAASIATHTGFNVSSVEDALWIMSPLCADGESPLNCEYRLSKPSVAVIMFGTNDIGSLSPVEFDFFMRLVTFDTIDHGIIPLLSTFPGYPGREERTHLMNQIIYEVGRDYDVPVMNLWLALQPLPGNGRNPKSMYLSWNPEMRTSDFTPYSLQFGHTMRNLITLQALDILRREVLLGTVGG